MVFDGSEMGQEIINDFNDEKLKFKLTEHGS